MIQMACRTKEVASVPRDFGSAKRDNANVKQPSRNAVIETRDLSQAKGLERG